MMPGVLLVLALVSPVQDGGKLDLGNVRLAYDALGPIREAPANPKILPGERLHYLFDIGGLKPDEAGRIRFATILEIAVVKDGKSETLIKNNFGEVFQVGIPGTKFRHSVHINIGIDLKAGQYKIKVPWEDLNGKGTGTFERDFTVEPMAFGLVAFQYAFDRDRTLPAPSVLIVGQTVQVHVGVVGMKVDDKTTSGLKVKMEVFDDKNQMIAAKPWTGEWKGFPTDTLAWPVAFQLPVQKAGVYKVVITANDMATNKTATLTTTFTAVDLK